MKKLLLTLLPALLLISANVNSQAVLLDGVDDFIDLGQDTTLRSFESTITLESWVYITEFKAQIHEGVVLAMDENGENGFAIRAGAAGMVDFVLGEHNTTLVWYVVGSPENTISLNTWHHIAATYDGANQILYVDGLEVANEARSFQIGNASQPLYIGDSPSWRGRNFPGLIDDMRIWNVARTAAEIFENKDKELCGDETGLVSYYTFNENTGTTVGDLAGDNDGVFGGSVDSTDHHPTWIAQEASLTDADCGPTSITNIPTTSSSLDQCYPNPASGMNKISYTVENPSFVTIKLYSVLGKEAKTLVNEFLPAGNYSSLINISELYPGIYFYKMHVDNQLTGNLKLIVQ